METKQQGISGYWLKVIAVVSMLIDHTSAVILEQIPGLEAPAFFMRIIGRAAFPIYCFLLVEGFYHTRSRAKYAGRLFLFALISEVPFDLAFSRRMWDFSSSNVFFTLLFGLLVIWGVEGIKQKFVEDVYGNKAAVIRLILTIVIVAAGGFLALLFRTDYDLSGIVTIFAIYMFYPKKVKGMGIGVFVLTLLASIIEAAAFLDMIPVYFYNGTRGKQIADRYNGRHVILGIRPEDIYEFDEAKKLGIENESVDVDESVVNREMLGAEVILYFDEQGKTLAVRLSPENQTQVGEKVSLYFDMEKAHVFDPETEENIFVS